jgi:hypothetical protein
MVTRAAQPALLRGLGNYQSDEQVADETLDCDERLALPRNPGSG